MVRRTPPAADRMRPQGAGSAVRSQCNYATARQSEAARGRGGRGCQFVYGLTTRNVNLFGALQQWLTADAHYAWAWRTNKATSTRRSNVHFMAIRPHAAESQLRALFVVLLARRIVASRRNELVVHFFGEAEALLHVGHDLDDLADEVGFFVLHHFGNEVRTDGLPILIE